MTDIKLFVTHSPNKNAKRIHSPLFYNVIAGSCFQTEPVPDGMYLDNQGQNIAELNKSYCELTTQYYAWKNINADYYGFCHYRRFFSFSRQTLPESVWGTIEYDFLNDDTIHSLKLEEAAIRNYVEQYDFLIAKGIPASAMQSDTIYNHYKNAPELHIEDVDLFLDIIQEKYSYLYKTAVSFFKGSTFYPCNMFIMKKELFFEYSEILFDILQEFMSRADMSSYSREGYRTPGHLGERLAGIYYLYLKERDHYRLGELQIALIHNTDDTPDICCNNTNTVPIVLAADQNYVPVLYTCVQSILDHTSSERDYEIYIFHTNISAGSQAIFTHNLQQKNIKITFVNVSSHVNGYRLKAKEHITTETFYRFLILDLLKDYPKAVYLDSDMIICNDIAQLYDIDLGNCLIGATLDPDFSGQCNKKDSGMRQYCKNVLHLDDPFQYFQAGTLLLNVQKLREVTSVQELFEMSDTGIYRFSDQDILNIICKGQVKYLDMKWNMMFDCNHDRVKNVIKSAPYYILDQYETARKDPYIIHYAGFLKPWMDPDADFAAAFWQTARETEYYEILISRMQEYLTRKYSHTANVIAANEPTSNHYFVEAVRKVARHLFPKNSKSRVWAIGVYRKLANK